MSQRSYNQNNNTEKNGHLIIISIVVLLAVLGGMMYYSNIKNKNESEKLLASQQEYLERSRAEKTRLEQLKANDSFYQKLADGFDVNVLIVGDSIGAGTGSTNIDNQWANLLSSNIKKKYDVSVRLTNISMGGNTSYAGYVRTMALNDGIDYDLVVICYGQNDSDNNFSLYYESIIRAVKNKYPHASIISILESSQRTFTNKMQTIQSLAKHYGIPVADTITPFKSNYDALVKDGVHPNDDGHQIYYEKVMGIIEPLVTKRKGYDPTGVSTINQEVKFFDTFQWFDVNQFKRNGNTFTLNTTTKGSVLGIDYNFTSGNNSCKILVDGINYAAPEVTFKYDFSQRHIMIINDWLNGKKVNVKSEIKIIFGEDEAGKKQADGFKGIAISG